MPIPIILDTDIGSDVDDALALALILASPEVELLGISCVYGDVTLRARMALKLLRLAGREDVPVHAGAERPLLGQREVWWAGHEGQGLLGPEDDALEPAPEPAVELIRRTVRSRPGEVHLAAVGPLTNVALALAADPELAGRLAGLWVMGGVVREGTAKALAPADHNFRCDPQAAHIVLNAGAPLHLVTWDVTRQVWIDGPGVERLKAVGTPYHAALADQVERYPRFAELGRTNLHDPLTVAALLSDFVRFRPLHVQIEQQGGLTDGATQAWTPADERPANTQVSREVNAPAFERFYLDRVAAPLPTG